MGSVAARVVSGGNFRPLLRRNLDDELIYILQVSGRLNWSMSTSSHRAVMARVYTHLLTSFWTFLWNFINFDIATLSAGKPICRPLQVFVLMSAEYCLAGRLVAAPWVFVFILPEYSLIGLHSVFILYLTCLNSLNTPVYYYLLYYNLNVVFNVV